MFYVCSVFFFSSRRRQTRCALVTGVQTCALPIWTVHHAAFTVADLDVQAQVKFDIEGLGYTDVSDRKHRGYFESIYVRTPGGVLFEATSTIGFTHDEEPERLGNEVKVAPQLEGMKDELIARMTDQIVAYTL